MSDSEVEIIFAFLFKRSGKEEMSLSELYLPLSIDLNWFTPNKAKDLVNFAIKKKILIKKGDVLTPAFDFKMVDVPVGFHPSEKRLWRTHTDI